MSECMIVFPMCALVICQTCTMSVTQHRLSHAMQETSKLLLLNGKTSS